MLSPTAFSRFAPLYEWLTVHTPQRESIAQLSQRIPADAQVLDVACGPGLVLQRLLHAQPQRRGIGLDMAAGALQRAQRRIPVVRGSATALPFTDASFDCVLITGALYLMPHPDQVLREMRRVSRQLVLVAEAGPAMQPNALLNPQRPLPSKARLDYLAWSLAMQASARYSPATLATALQEAGLAQVAVGAIARGMILIAQGQVPRTQVERGLDR